MPERDPVQDEFSALIDHELDPETRATVEARLAESAELLRELHGMKQVSDLYAALPKVAAPKDFETLTRQRMAREHWRRGLRTRLRKVWIPAAIAAAAVYIVGASFYLARDIDRGATLQTARQDAVPQIPSVSPEKAEEMPLQAMALEQAPPDASSDVARMEASEYLGGQREARSEPPPSEAAAESADATKTNPAQTMATPLGRALDEAGGDAAETSATLRPQDSKKTYLKEQEIAIKNNNKLLSQPHAAPVASTAQNHHPEEVASASAGAVLGAQPAEDGLQAQPPALAPAAPPSETMLEDAAPLPSSKRAVAQGAPRAVMKGETFERSGRGPFTALGQHFAFRNGCWTASDYSGERVSAILPDSALFQALERDYKEAAEALLGHRPVIFKFQEAWYLLEKEQRTTPPEK